MSVLEPLLGAKGRRYFGVRSLLLVLSVPWRHLSSVCADSGDAPQGSETKYKSDPSEAGPSKAFTLNAGIDLSETYLTNVLGTAVPGDKKGDYDSRAALDLGLHEHTLRLSADATYTLAADYFCEILPISV